MGIEQYSSCSVMFLLAFESFTLEQMVCISIIIILIMALNFFLE